MINLLIAQNADPNKKNKSGKTALNAAAKNGDVDMVQALLTANTTVNTLDNNGNTPLDLAIQENHTAIIKILQINAQSLKKNIIKQHGDASSCLLKNGSPVTNRTALNPTVNKKQPKPE